MNKEFEARYSRLYSLIFAAVFVVLTALNVYMNLSGRATPYVTVLLALMAAVVICYFALTVSKRGIAVEVTDEKIVFYKRAVESFPIDGIKSAYVNEGFGSFDVRIELYNGERHGVSCFVKDARSKKSELAKLLIAKGIDTENYYEGRV